MHKKGHAEKKKTADKRGQQVKRSDYFTDICSVYAYHSQPSFTERKQQHEQVRIRMKGFQM